MMLDHRRTNASTFRARAASAAALLAMATLIVLAWSTPPARALAAAVGGEGEVWSLEPSMAMLELKDPPGIVARTARQRDDYAARLALGAHRELGDLSGGGAIITFRVLGAELAYDLLSEADQAAVAARLPDRLDPAEAYENAMAALLHHFIRDFRELRPDAYISIFGLPIETVRTPDGRPRLTNARYERVIQALDALVSSKSFIVFGNDYADGRGLREAVRFAQRYDDGRPFYVRKNGRWVQLDPSQFEDVTERREAARQETSGGSGRGSGSGGRGGGDTSGGGSRNRVPDSQPDMYSVVEGGRLRISSPGVLRNDSDPEGERIVSLILGRTSHGEVTLNRDGSFTYTPDDGYSGTDRFRYQVRDKHGALSDPAAVSIAVTRQRNSGGSGGEGEEGGGEWGQYTDGYDADGDGLHDFTGLPLTEDGWTDFNAMIDHPDHYNDARIIYVSSSTGTDTTQYRFHTPDDPEVGDDPFNPAGDVYEYKTIATAYAKLRDGYPDIMLLKRGDTWNEDLPTWTKSGRSVAERMVFGSYGSLDAPRPVIKGFRTSYGPNSPEDRFDFVAVTSIAWTGTFSREVGGRDFLIEDCATFGGENSGMTIQGLGPEPLRQFALRRCVVAGRYPNYENGTGHTQGLFVKEVSGGLIEDNVFDQNGWNPQGSGLDAGNIHSHNTYVSVDNEHIVMRYNISTRAGSHGLQMGAGGLLYANLSVRDSIAIQMARSETWVPNGLSGVIKSNVVLDPKDIRKDVPGIDDALRGWGIRLMNTSEVVVEDNILGDNLRVIRRHAVTDVVVLPETDLA